MNRFLLFTLLCIILSASIENSLFAVPAYPHPIEFSQPDGSVINLIIKGDEKVRWAQTLDGYTLLFNKHGFYEYAIINEEGNLVPSGVKANDIEKRTSTEKAIIAKLKKELFFNPDQIGIMKQIWDMNEKESPKAFPTTGNRKLVCILVGFKDKAFTKTHDDFDNLFNQVGYSAGGATGSVKDYYLENSYQQFNLTVDVAGPYTLSENMSYYGANSSTGSDARPQIMVREAVYNANVDVNFADYDNDEDGNMDGVYVIFAGYGEEAGGGADAIWSHAWSLIPGVSLDGVVIARYSCSPELKGNSGTTITAIGVICHEFGHVLGAPDYYDTNYETGGEFIGTGQWDMMAGGSWNNGGVTPAHHNGFTKVMVYGWADAKILSTGKTVTLYNTIDDSSSYYRYDTKTSNEYFFIEYREKHNFDGSIPGSGMIIYHVHSGVMSAMNSNSINNTHPQRMYPVAANALSEPNSNSSSYGNINYASCAWTGLGGKTDFTDTTIPSSKSWAGDNTEKPITNVWRDDVAKTVTFDFMGGTTEAEEFIATASSVNQIDISWIIPEGKEVILAYSETGDFGVPVDGTNYSADEAIPDGGTVLYAGSDQSFSHINLKSRTNYYYKIWMKLADDKWSVGMETQAETLFWIIDTFPWVDGFEEDNNGSLSDWWWQEQIIEGSENWQVVSENGSNPATSHEGSNFAVLKDTDSEEDKTMLVSPEFDFTSLKSAEVSFWYFLEEKDGVQDELRIYSKTAWDEEWTLIVDAEYTTSIAEWTKVTLSIPEPLSTTYYVGIEGYSKFGHGVCVDSVAVFGEPKATYSLSLNIEGNGMIEVDGVEYTEPIEVYEGTELSLEAIADFGWSFDSWSGDLEETENPTIIVMDSDKEITVTFTENPKYSLEITVVGQGLVEVDGTEYTETMMIYEGTEVALEAKPVTGWQFDEWTGDLTGVINPQNLTVSANKSVTATFSQATGNDADMVVQTNIFPNPFDGTLSVSNAREINSVVITNLIGQKVMEMQVAGQEIIQLNTDHLAKGIYLISLSKSNGDRVVRKVVKR